MILTISGTLEDPNQNRPVEGALVELWTQRIESGIFVANFIKDGTAITGPNGEFQFSIPSKSYTAVKLVFSHNQYYGWEAPINSEELKQEQSFVGTFQILPKSYVNFHVINRNPFDASDYFEFRILNGYSGCEECCREAKYQFSGMSVDQIVECQSAGHTDLLIQWSSRKNNQQIFKTEAFFLKAFEINTITFEY